MLEIRHSTAPNLRPYSLMASTKVIEQAGGLPLPVATISDAHSQDDVEPITPGAGF